MAALFAGRQSHIYAASINTKETRGNNGRDFRTGCIRKQCNNTHQLGKNPKKQNPVRDY
jgi:hypothetical protein